MGFTVASQHFRLPRRLSREETSLDVPLPTYDADTQNPVRPQSALARHQPHTLSEIREVSGSSRATLFRRHSSNFVDGPRDACRAGHSEAPQSTKKHGAASLLDLKNSTEPYHSRQHSSTSEFGSFAPSALSLPLNNIPNRKSSITALTQSYTESHANSLQNLRSEGIGTEKIVASRERTRSPVKQAHQKGPQSSETFQLSPPRTFIRTTTPFCLLENAQAQSSRLGMTLRLPSPLFVGGGTVEGQIGLKVDTMSNKKTKSKPLFISKLSVDIIGVEEVTGGRRRIFLSLATELFDSRHPPPLTLVTSQNPEKGSELYWRTQPSVTNIPFCLNLPLKLGPPPYTSRQASIRYFLCPSVAIRIGEQRLVVRQKWTIQMLTVYDPEKALASLPSPLLATDTFTVDHGPMTQLVKLTAGLHRQTWVSGGAIFIDIHIKNSTDYHLKKVEVQLEKSILWFSHTAAGTTAKRASNLRLPTQVESEIVCKNVIKKSKEWDGVVPQASEARTCEIDIPKGHVTIGNGQFFEVRYFVSVNVPVTRNKSVSVQLPVTLIHINSLDIMPNSLVQVASSIEAKRSLVTRAMGNCGSRQPHTQGQAFSVARQQSLSQAQNHERTISEDLSHLRQALDKSPRNARTGNIDNRRRSDTQVGNRMENVPFKRAACPQHLSECPTCYHCHLRCAQHASKTAQQEGPKLPRLQVSTSGLGFSESEFEIPPDSPPRKVMLSERERQMINQQRELGVQRQLRQQQQQQQQRNYAVHRPRDSNASASFVGWKNVAVPSAPLSGRPLETKPDQGPAGRHMIPRRPVAGHRQQSSFPAALPYRSRSRIDPGQTKPRFSNATPALTSVEKSKRGMRSLDRGDRRAWSSHNLSDDVFAPKGAPGNRGVPDS